MQLHWDLPKNTRIGRTTNSIPFTSASVFTLTDIEQSGDPMMTVILPLKIIQHDQLGGESEMIAGYIYFKGCRDLYVIANGTGTTVRYQD